LTSAALHDRVKKEVKYVQLQQLFYVAEVAERGSINKAAEALFISQPSLSKAIINLESELNIRIFDRNNKGATLTEEGKSLYQYVRTILNQMELIEGISASDAPKVLSVASYPVLTVSRALAEFYRRRQGSGIALRMREVRLAEVVEAVASSSAEIGIVFINNAQFKEFKHTIGYKNLEFNPIAQDTWYINAGPESPLYDRSEVSMEELLDYPIIRQHDDYFSNLTFYLEIDGVKLTSFKKTVHVNNYAAIVNMLRTTDVFRFTPGVSRLDFELAGIRTIPIRNCQVEVSIGWLRRKKELLSPGAMEFVDIFTDLCSEALDH
jgi:DNA-binding transcriptional LysR family regulator